MKHPGKSVSDMLALYRCWPSVNFDLAQRQFVRGRVKLTRFILSGFIKSMA
jgi:hypothetical protein